MKSSISTSARRGLKSNCLPPATGTWVEIPSGDKPVLLVFWDPRDAMSVKFLEKAASLRKEFPGMTVMPIAPVSEEGVKKALLNLNLDIPSLVDAQAVAFKDYRVAHTPRVYCWTPRGRFCAGHPGYAVCRQSLCREHIRRKGRMKKLPRLLRPHLPP